MKNEIELASDSRTRGKHISRVSHYPHPKEEGDPGLAFIPNLATESGPGRYNNPSDLKGFLPKNTRQEESIETPANNKEVFSLLGLRYSSPSQRQRLLLHTISTWTLWALARVLSPQEVPNQEVLSFPAGPDILLPHLETQHS